MAVTEVAGQPGYYVREILTGEALPLLALADEARGLRLVELSVCDAEGAPLLAEGAALELPFRVFMALLQAANRVNGLGEAQVQAAEGN